MAETIKCVHCQSPLRLPEQFNGQEVRCPSCQKTFTAQLPAEPSVPVRPPSREPEDEPYGVEPPAAQRSRDDDRPSRRRRRPRDDEEEDEDYPKGRRSRYDDEGYPRRRYPYDDRSGMILTLGIVSLVLLLVACACSPLALISIGLGLTAAIMGRSDLAQMKNGQRDPSGESMTNIGSILGIISCVIAGLLLLLSCLYFVFGVMNH